MTSPSVGVLVFPDVELLDFAGPLEVMAESVAASGGRCFTVSPERMVVTNPSRLRVLADYLLEGSPSVDVLVVPGGPGASRIQAHTEVLVGYVRSVAERGAVIASVCTGAFILGRAGLLDGRHCTTHVRYRERLQADFPRSRVESATVVTDGPRLVTAANVASGIDLSLHLLERLFGAGRADAVRASLNYPTRSDELVARHLASPAGDSARRDGPGASVES